MSTETLNPSRDQSIEKINKQQTVISQLENENKNLSIQIKKLKTDFDELITKLDLALKENLSLQNENNLIKAETETEILRLSIELEEALKEIESKNKLLAEAGFIEDKKSGLGSTSSRDKKTNLEILKSYSSLKHFPNRKIEFLTPVNKSQKIPQKFLQSYSKSFMNIKRDSFLENIMTNEKFSFNYKKSKENFIINSVAQKTQNLNTSEKGSFVFNNLNANIKEFQNNLTHQNLNERKNLFDDFDDEEEMEFIKQRIDNEIQNILENRKNFVLSTLTQENFSFDIICENKKIEKNTHELKFYKTEEIFGNNIQNQNQASNNKKAKVNKKILQNMNDILQKIKNRKNKIIEEKKNLQNQLEKVGINILN